MKGWESPGSLSNMYYEIFSPEGKWVSTAYNEGAEELIKQGMATMEYNGLYHYLKLTEKGKEFADGNLGRFTQEGK